MTKTLAVNAGSSSMKWQMYEMPEEKVLAKGLIERIGLKDSIVTVKFGEQKEERVFDIPDHTEAVEVLLEDLKRLKIVEEFTEITGVGHRVVAGGEIFQKSTVVTPEVLQQVKDLSALAPLHNPANAAGIEAFLNLLPDATSVVVFDTAFHTTMPEKAFRYPLPKKYYTDYVVRKYGAHGTSHMYVSQEAAKLLGKPIEETKIITAHIGNGASLTAVKGGKSIDTSMGFTPLAGVMMGTRTGEMDPSVFPYLIENDSELKDAQGVVDMMNKESGLYGVSGISSDMRDIIAAKDTDTDAKLAFEMYVDRIQKFIGQYLAVLNGADALVFTAGIGENSVPVREAILSGLTWFGIEVDPEKNVFGVEGEISTPHSRVKVFVIPTDEELVIARDVEALKK
ncbi:acetate kinase [Lactococcus lactis]|uniref:acetate kinase n=1 Tax=Lactococcus lactis TaxID=1358 RepID=UPI0025A0C96B|nr:acetate kinase [Lactococcus lactis]MDM7510597.1 acetate kinase [Lactococcus lactis]MDM7544272.1 acetate kinase [Lactococcus lactis]